MYTLRIILICYILFVSFVAMKGHDDVRTKRFLSFRNISRFFFRFNFKANMVPWNQIFTQVWGFRMNWDDPPDSFHPYHHLTRRSLYDTFEELLDRNGLSGFHCVRRAVCEINMISKPNELYYKILKLIFRQKSSATDRWHNYTSRDCQTSSTNCPFSVLDVAPYTDL